jgi:hypothetical protein
MKEKEKTFPGNGSKDSTIMFWMRKFKVKSVDL